MPTISTSLRQRLLARTHAPRQAVAKLDERSGGRLERVQPRAPELLRRRWLGAVPTACEITERSLRKREHRPDIQVFELGVVAFQLRHRFLLPKPVHVLAKRLRVDGLLVNVRLDQSIFLLLDAVQPPWQLVGGLLLRLLLT